MLFLYSTDNPAKPKIRKGDQKFDASEPKVFDRTRCDARARLAPLHLAANASERYAIDSNALYGRTVKNILHTVSEKVSDSELRKIKYDIIFLYNELTLHTS